MHAPAIVISADRKLRGGARAARGYPQHFDRWLAGSKSVHPGMLFGNFSCIAWFSSVFRAHALVF